MYHSKPLPPIPADHHKSPFDYDTFQMELKNFLPSATCLDHVDQTERRPSETSCPSLLGDSYSSISDIEHIEYSSSDDGWDAYWSPSKSSSRTPSMHLDVAVRPVLKSQLSYENRNFGTSNLYALHPQSKKTSIVGDLHKPLVPRTRKKRSNTFSPMLPSTVFAPERPSRARANTSPVEPTQDPHCPTTRPASDIRICTTMCCDSRASSTQGSPLYMMSYPFPSPAIAPFNLSDETSYFSDDEDDEPRALKLAKFLSRNNGSEEKERPRTGSGRLRRSFGDVRQGVKSVFRIKK